MHEYLKEAREGAERKLKGIQKGEPRTKVDSSSWSPPDMLEADKQNGMRPVSPRQYKSGGKVTGINAKKRADRKARKEGGRAMSVDGYINRDSKMANDERAGVKKIGGMKRGGRSKHAEGSAVPGLTPYQRKLISQGIDPFGGDRFTAPKVSSSTATKKNAPDSIPMDPSYYGKVPLPPRRPTDMAKPSSLPMGMAGRGLPEPDYTDELPIPSTYTTQGAKKGGKIRSKHAKGGAAHPDVKEDKALIRKMVKPSARTGKLSGGTLGSYIDKARENYLNDPNDLKTKQRMTDGVGLAASKISGGSGAKVPATYKKGGAAHTDEAGRGLYVRQGYPHEVPGADGGRTAKKRGGALGKGKTNIHINVMPHGGANQPPVMPPMGGPILPPPPPRPPMPPMGGMPAGAPMGGAPELPPMGAGRPGMPPIGRKHGGEIPAGMKTQHIIDNAAGGGLGRLEKIKAYGLN